MALGLLAEHSAELFARCFGHVPRWIVAAPGRVNLMGEHTDYNDGFVLPMAIERYTVIAADRHSTADVILHSITTGETATFSLRPPCQRGEPGWSNYVRGVIAGFQQRGAKPPGFDALIDSEVPYGGGLASSAALEVAAATLLEAMAGKRLDPVEKALLVPEGRARFRRRPLRDHGPVHVGPGSGRSRAACWTAGRGTTTAVPMTDAGVTVLIINTNVRHRLAEGEYAKRRAQCEMAARALKVPALRDATLKDLKQAESRLDPVVFRRARHVISENARTIETAKCHHGRRLEGRWQNDVCQP